VKSSKSGLLSNGPFYTLLVLYMPLSALAAMVFLLGESLSLPVAIIIISGCVSAVAASLYCDFMKDVKASRIAANIRGGIIVMVIFYGAASLMRQNISMEERFQPDLANITPALGAFYAWYSVVSLKQLFSARKRFEEYTELYRGEQLQKALYEDAYMLRYTDEEIIKKRRNYMAQLVIIGIFTLINVMSNIHISAALCLLLTGILAGGVGICGFFEVMRWEQYYAGEGIALSVSDRLNRIGGMGVFILLCVICAFFLASDKSLLPFSAVTGFFAWFFSLFRSLFFLFAGTSEVQPFEQPMDFIPPLPPPEESAPHPVLEWLVKYGVMILRYIVIVLVAGGFIRFMVSPLLNRGKAFGEDLTFRQKLIRIVTEWFKGLVTALASLFALLKGGKTRQKLNKHDAEAIRRAAASILGAYSPAKKQDMKRSVTLFARLIIWGGAVRQVVWKPAHAPGEYCGILAASARKSPEGEGAPDDDSPLKRVNEGIIRCGELFEKALYSAEVLSDEERTEFKDLIEEITETSV
jgi:hypothetical protein